MAGEPVPGTPGIGSVVLGLPKLVGSVFGSDGPTYRERIRRSEIWNDPTALAAEIRRIESDKPRGKLGQLSRFNLILFLERRLSELPTPVIPPPFTPPSPPISPGPAPTPSPLQPPGGSPSPRPPTPWTPPSTRPPTRAELAAEGTRIALDFAPGFGPAPVRAPDAAPVSGGFRYSFGLSAVPRPAPKGPPKRAPRRRPKPKPRPPRRPPRIPTPRIPRVPDIPVRFPRIPLPVPGLPGVILRGIQAAIRIYELLPKIQPPPKGPPRRPPPRKSPPDTAPVVVQVPPILVLPQEAPEVVISSPKPSIRPRNPAPTLPEPVLSVPNVKIPGPSPLPSSRPSTNLWPLGFLALPFAFRSSSSRRQLAPRAAPQPRPRVRVPGRPPGGLELAPGRTPIPELKTGFLASDFQTEAERKRCRCRKPRQRKRKTCYQGFYRESASRIRFERWDEVTCEGGKRGSRTPEQKRADRARRRKIREDRRARLTASKTGRIGLKLVQS